jgi:murein DD-endopeptidase MepM/ murein hydrolase activator NlpD
MKLRLVLLLLISLLSIPAFADRTEYQPQGVDGTDMWYSSQYNQVAVDSGTLQVGGWGDQYRTLIKFNLNCMPKTATSAYLYLYPYSRGDGSTPVAMNVYTLANYWNEQTSNYYDSVSYYTSSARTVAPPTPGQWYAIDITADYNNWQNGTYANYGFLLQPTGTNNQFNVFYSSDNATYPTLRPRLVVNYTPTPGFGLCFPLKQGFDAYTHPVTAIFDLTRTTGDNQRDGTITTYDGQVWQAQYGCSAYPSFATCSTSSASPNYYQNYTVVGFKKLGGGQFYPVFNYISGVPSSQGGSDNSWVFYDGHTGYDYQAAMMTPVYATAAGDVIVVGGAYNTLKIDHKNGYYTYYLHMNSFKPGLGDTIKTVQKGDFLGWSGKTGADAPHLHITIKKLVNGAEAQIDPYRDSNGVRLWE